MPVLQETVSSVTVAAVEVSTTVTLDDGDTLVEVTMTETSVTVAQADVSVVMQTEVGMPILIPGPPQGLEPWTQLTVIESPELTPIIAQDKYRYAVGVLFPSDHAGPGYPAEPSIVAIELPLAPYDGYEFSWMDRDNGFSEDTCFWIKPAAGATYDIDGFPAGDGLVIDVMDYNNGLAYCALTDSWNMVFARTELVGFGKVLIKGQFQAHLGVPVAAVDGEFWEATTAGTVLGSTIKVDDVCVFRENKTTVNVIPRITAADEASTAMTTAVALAASGAAGLYVPLSQWGDKLDVSAYNEHYRGKYVSLVALQTAVPTGNNGDNAVVDPGTGTDVVEYLWDAEEGWVQTGDVAASTTDALVEGSLNLYHTPGRAVSAALAGLLTGISFATNAAITAADSLLEALGKLQAQITGLLSSKADKVNPVAAVTSTAGVITIDAAATGDSYYYNQTENIVARIAFTNRPAAGSYRDVWLQWNAHASTPYTRVTSIGSTGKTAGGALASVPPLGSQEMIMIRVHGDGTDQVFPGGVFA